MIDVSDSLDWIKVNYVLNKIGSKWVAIVSATRWSESFNDNFFYNNSLN